MHSSRMRTTCSSSHLLMGGVCLCACWDTPLSVGLKTSPRCGPGDPRPDPSTSPLGVGLETLPGQTPQLPTGCGPGDPPGQTSQLTPWVWAWRPPRPDPLTFPWVWAWRPARYAGKPPPWRPASMLGYHLQCMLGNHIPPVDRMTDTCKNSPVKD